MNPKIQEIGIRFIITDCSNFEKRCSGAHFVSFLFCYYCTIMCHLIGLNVESLCHYHENYPFTELELLYGANYQIVYVEHGTADKVCIFLQFIKITGTCNNKCVA